MSDIVESPVSITPPSGELNDRKMYRQDSPPIDFPDQLTEALELLHADELIALVQHPDAKRATQDIKYWRMVINSLVQYAKFFVNTWFKTAWSIFTHPFTILDLFSLFIFACLSTGALFVLMIWCFVANFPPFYNLFRQWSTTQADGLSVVNAADPGMFRSLSPTQAKTGREALSRSIRYTQDTSTRRVFNLDIARILLQCSALMYERSAAHVREALNSTTKCLEDDFPERHPHREDTDIPPETIPGRLVRMKLGEDAARAINYKLHHNPEENVIAKYSNAMGLVYHTLSDLNSVGSAYCGMFYDPEGDFIILSFKGTSAAEFEEWMTDMTYDPMDAGPWIRGFGKVHGGFLERIFPRKLKTPGSRLPYETIREGVNKAAAHLLKRRPDGTEISIWFTGHSLGCAIASLAYSRAINEPKEFGPNTRIRDCYLFAAPIVCDPQSVSAFNNRMYHDPHRPRTMWRCTNGHDAVATGLPHFGDFPAWGINSYNLFNFAHLGTEVRMKSKPLRSLLKGNHILPGSQVRVETAVPMNVVGHENGDDVVNLNGVGDNHAGHSRPTEKNALAKLFGVLSYVPVVSSLVDHVTTLYWDQLNKLAIGHCDWAEY